MGIIGLIELPKSELSNETSVYYAYMFPAVSILEFEGVALMKKIWKRQE